MNRLPLLGILLGLIILSACSSSRKATNFSPFHITPGIYYDALRGAEKRTHIYGSSTELINYRESRLRRHGNGERKRDWHRPSTLPRFDIVSSDRKHITNSDLMGRITVFNFWMEMCPPCMKEIPWLCSLRDSFPESNFIAVTIEDCETAKRIMSTRNFNWAHVVADSTFTDWLPSETWYPTTIVVDQNGFVRTFNVGNDPIQQKRVVDTIRAIQSNGPLNEPRYYKDLHYDEEYTIP